MSEALTAEQLQERLQVSPFIRFLGLIVTEADPARQQVTMTAPMRPEFERIAGSADNGMADRSPRSSTQSATTRW